MILLLLAALLFPQAPGLKPQAPGPGGAGARLGPAPVIVDAIRAAVNRQAITQSEVRQAAWYSRLVSDLHQGVTIPSAPPPLTAAERQRALDHLIDEALLSQARHHAGPRDAPPPAAIAQQLGRMQALAGGAAAWPVALRRYHLSATAVRAIVSRQMTLLLFADAHCRRQARVTQPQVAAYYRQSFLPLAHRAHIRPAPLAVVAPSIRAILLQRQLMRLELEWLRRLRSRARIQIFPAP